MINQVRQEISQMIQQLRTRQASDGRWIFCFENGIFGDAYMIILLRALEIDDEALITKLVFRIKSKQNENGTWKLYADENEGNLSATIEAYFALLYSGHVKPNDPQMVRAKKFIRDQGGLASAGIYTKSMLAITGQYPWPEYLKMPMELVLLPTFVPFNIFDFVGYARVHFVPIMICANKKFTINTDRTPNLSDLYLPKNRFASSELDTFQLHASTIQGLNEISQIPNSQSLAYKRAEEFLLKRIENDGTLYNYFSATFLMVFALLALGYKKDSTVILRAVNGLKTFACQTNSTITIQNSPSDIWDTALLSYALQEAGVLPSDLMIKKSVSFLLSEQQTKFGDWALNNPRVLPGGWGFTSGNTINPDVDDSTAALRAIRKFTSRNSAYLSAWNRGVNWVLSMQNNDGGWPAFEKNKNKRYTKLLPIKGVGSVTTDPSSADLTGRALEFFGNDVGLNLRHSAIHKGVNWLLSHQENNGSWYGRWGISYIYGTWAAVTGLLAVGIPTSHPSIQKAQNWLLKIQNNDGGWGESCKSDVHKEYFPLHVSTPSQTAWALDTLIAINNRPIPAIQKGVQTLMKIRQEETWNTHYPTGAGYPGIFYTHYHSYRYIWPLLALAHYRKKYDRNEY